jgi:hypothetical protein
MDRSVTSSSTGTLEGITSSLARELALDFLRLLDRELLPDFLVLDGAGGSG